MTQIRLMRQGVRLIHEDKAGDKFELHRYDLLLRKPNGQTDHSQHWLGLQSNIQH